MSRLNSLIKFKLNFNIFRIIEDDKKEKINKNITLSTKIEELEMKFNNEEKIKKIKLRENIANKISCESELLKNLKIYTNNSRVNINKLSENLDFQEKMNYNNNYLTSVTIDNNQNDKFSDLKLENLNTSFLIKKKDGEIIKNDNLFKNEFEIKNQICFSLEKVKREKVIDKNDYSKSTNFNFECESENFSICKNNKEKDEIYKYKDDVFKFEKINNLDLIPIVRSKSSTKMNRKLTNSKESRKIKPIYNKQNTSNINNEKDKKIINFNKNNENSYRSKNNTYNKNKVDSFSITQIKNFKKSSNNKISQVNITKIQEKNNNRLDEIKNGNITKGNYRTILNKNQIKNINKYINKIDINSDSKNFIEIKKSSEKAKNKVYISQKILSNNEILPEKNLNRSNNKESKTIEINDYESKLKIKDFEIKTLKKNISNFANKISNNPKFNLTNVESKKVNDMNVNKMNHSKNIQQNSTSFSFTPLTTLRTKIELKNNNIKNDEIINGKILDNLEKNKYDIKDEFGLLVDKVLKKQMVVYNKK